MKPGRGSDDDGSAAELQRLRGKLLRLSVIAVDVDVIAITCLVCNEAERNYGARQPTLAQLSEFSCACERDRRPWQ